MKSRVTHPSILVVLSFIITLIFAEIGLRMMGLMRTFSEVSNQLWSSNFGGSVDVHYHLHQRDTSYRNTNGDFDIEHVTNSLGFVGPLPQRQKTGKRIVFFGDSFTEGVGALSPDSSCPKLMQDILHRQFGELSTEVLNFGVGGCDVVFATKYLEDSTSRFSPDLVIMLFNNTDVFDIIQRGGQERFLADGSTAFRSGPWFLPLVKYSLVMRLIVVNGFGYDSELWMSKDNVAKEREWALNEAIAHAIRAKKASNQMGAEFLFVLMPFGTELAYQRQEVQDQFQGMMSKLKNHGVRSLNLRDGMAPHINQENFKEFSWWKYEGHYKHTGYLLMAQLIVSTSEVKALYMSAQSDTMQILAK